MNKPLFADWHTTPAKECLQVGERIDKETFLHFRENCKKPTKKFIQMDEVADIAGNEPLYDTIFRDDIFSPWSTGRVSLTTSRTEIRHLCRDFICSRYRADSKKLAKNIEVAKWVCQDVVENGAIPIAPHLYFPRFV